MSRVSAEALAGLAGAQKPALPSALAGLAGAQKPALPSGLAGLAGAQVGIAKGSASWAWDACLGPWPPSVHVRTLRSTLQDPL